VIREQNFDYAHYSSVINNSKIGKEGDITVESKEL
jgi:hypothetical protein